MNTKIYTLFSSNINDLNRDSMNFETSIFKAKCIQKLISSGAAFHYTRAIFRCWVVMELLSYHQQLCAQKFFQVHSYRKS